MSTETTYMKIGKGPSGLIGQTTNSRSVTIWADIHHWCSEVLTELESLRSKNKKNENKHKEEKNGRIKSDMEDRKKLRATLQNCIHPLKVEQHITAHLVNIYTGEEASENVNVTESIKIGIQQMTEFHERFIKFHLYQNVV